MQEKKWYQSKITLLGIAASVLFISNFVTGWLTGQGVSPEQFAILESAYPTIANAIKTLDSGASIITVLGAVINPLIVIWRVWFTNAKIALPTL